MAYDNLEGSHSGRVRALGKRVSPKGDRGFESPSLRKSKSASNFATGKGTFELF